jgi:iron-sulfur cluster repair protein YtfE (RIC family)
VPQLPPSGSLGAGGAGDAGGAGGELSGLEPLLAQLSETHGRFEQRLEALQGLARHLRQHGPDERARSVAAEVLTFFDGHAPAHRADEERDVLPMLRRCGGAAGAALATRLEAEHGLLAHAWNACRPALAELGATGRWPEEAAALEFERWRDLASLAMAHMLAENGAAFPALRALMRGLPPLR